MKDARKVGFEWLKELLGGVVFVKQTIFCKKMKIIF